MTALLQDVHSSLTFWPEGCRAILLASAGRNVSGRTWWSDVLSRTDASDGAGALDAEEGVRIAQQRRWRDAPATRRGWDIGTLSSSVVGSDRLATFRHHISVPITLLAPTVKVALAWDSAVTSSGDTPTASTLTVDLDLLVRDSGGALVASAASWDNSYEVVEFAARPGETLRGRHPPVVRRRQRLVRRRVDGHRAVHLLPLGGHLLGARAGGVMPAAPEGRGTRRGPQGGRA